MNLGNVANFFLLLKNLTARENVQFHVTGNDDKETFVIVFIFHDPKGSGITSVSYMIQYSEILGTADVYSLVVDVFDDAVHLCRAKYNKKVQERMIMSMGGTTYDDE